MSLNIYIANDLSLVLKKEERILYNVISTHLNQCLQTEEHKWKNHCYLIHLQKNFNK